jgi:DNA-binding MarR family transcriptional regulator
LENGGYIHRQPNPKDGRSILVNFSSAKQGKVKAHYDAIEQQFAGVLKSSPTEELKTVLAFFAKMNAARSSTVAAAARPAAKTK